MSDPISRRQWFRYSAASGLGLATTASAAPQPGGTTISPEIETDYKLFFGDLHNHNDVGYAKGTFRRAFEIARNHLDFFAFTPHASWHDMKEYRNNIENKWINGFAVTRVRWPEVLRTVKEFHAPGEFVTIPAYEWHSSEMGDYHVLFPGEDAKLYLPQRLEDLQDFARKRGCLMVPHHPANFAGQRGANFARRDPTVSPLLEIYSEWGNAERDRGPYPYVRHSHGGRWTRNTLQYFLEQGHRIGVIASTDDHLGYPGAYREGLAAVLATDLSRGAVFDALRNRRTYAVTGDRIALGFALNGRIMGQELPYERERELRVDVCGWDEVDRVEILKNNRVIHRDFPIDRPNTPASWKKPVLTRLEYGWGPWAALSMGGTCDWEIELTVENGILEDVQPAFLPGPLEEDRRDRILNRTEKSVRLRSFTGRKQTIDDCSQKALALKISGGPDTRLKAVFSSPARLSITRSLKELAESNEIAFVGPYPAESVLLHRLVFNENFQTSFLVEDEDDGRETNWYYARVTQSNGQLAWSSPIWVEKRPGA